MKYNKNSKILCFFGIAKKFKRIMSFITKKWRTYHALHEQDSKSLKYTFLKRRYNQI